MNRAKIIILEPANFILTAFDSRNRQKQEMISLLKLQKKNDFLSKYNVAIRLLFLYYLRRGFDIQNERVHTVFKWFCVNELQIESYKIQAIINARHNLKYNYITPSNSVEENLEEIIRKIKASSAERMHS